ncbi:MAG TPA: aminotransferase class I/II-fold pyridoxal phosphate-dependent enzyme [Caulobacteraceae bacterium]
MSTLDFPALVSGGEGLNRYPAEPEGLRRRMAEVYGVAPEQVLPTRGATHALELVLRAAGRSGASSVCGDGSMLPRLARLYGLDMAEDGADVRVVTSPSSPRGEVFPAEAARAAAGEIGLLVVDESAIEFADAPSLARLTAEVENLVVLRSLSLAYGLAGIRCGAAVAHPSMIERLRRVLEPHALPIPCVRAAEAVLSPSRALAVDARVRLVRTEKVRMRDALQASADVRLVTAGQGPFLFVETDAVADLEARLARYGAQAWSCEGGLRVDVGPPESNDRALAAFGGLSEPTARRLGEAVRDTKETRIVASVDLDRAGDTAVRTGVGFFDHMLEQVAAHGGFSLRLACQGDLETDPHHTVEDSALAFGCALRQALGDKAGIGRYGFVAPMDEAEASLSLDLGGRPYSVFEGAFSAERIGEYPTALTPHVFRSLADSLGAAIHVRVTGEDDHHKTEVCFKALGRALRQAVRVEGGGVPSTKGMIA